MSILNNMPVRFLDLTGISFEMSRDLKNVYYLDCMTGMKSQLHLYHENGKYIARMRYDREAEIETFEDFHSALRSCMCGRDFLSSQWIDVYNDGFGEFDYDTFE